MAALGSGFPCPCCGYLTLPDEPSGTYLICPVCRWEDDNLQFDDGNLRGGANRVNLKHAQANFRRFGKGDPDRRGEVRPPLPHERPVWAPTSREDEVNQRGSAGPPQG